MRLPSPGRAGSFIAAAGLALAFASTVELATSAAPRTLPHPFSVPISAPATAVASAPLAPARRGPVPEPTVSPTPKPNAPFRPAANPLRGGQPPVRLSIASMQISAPVRPIGDSGGDLAIPDEVSTIGWWVGSAPPGSSTGSTVLVGHVDSAAQGPGSFYHLDRVTPAASIVVTTADGRSVRYRVAALQISHKAVGLPAADLAQSGSPRLVLITCGGPFDTDTGSYLDNIVVTALPQP